MEDFNFFADINNLALKFIRNSKEPSISQSNFEKGEQSCMTHSYKAKIIKKVWYWHMVRHIDRSIWPVWEVKKGFSEEGIFEGWSNSFIRRKESTDNGSESGGRSIAVLGGERTRVGVSWVRLEKYTGTRPPRPARSWWGCGPYCKNSREASCQYQPHVEVVLNGAVLPPRGYFGTLWKLFWLSWGLGMYLYTFYLFQSSNEGIANT